MEDQELALTDADDPFKELQEEIDNLQLVHFAEIQTLLHNAEIIDDYLGTDDIPDEGDDDNVEKIEVDDAVLPCSGRDDV